MGFVDYMGENVWAPVLIAVGIALIILVIIWLICRRRGQRRYDQIILDEERTLIQKWDDEKRMQKMAERAILEDQGGPPTWRLHTKLYNFARNISMDILLWDNAHTLKLGELSSLFVMQLERRVPGVDIPMEQDWREIRSDNVACFVFQGPSIVGKLLENDGQRKQLVEALIVEIK